MVDSFPSIRTTQHRHMLQAFLLSCRALYSALFLNVIWSYCLPEPFVIHGNSWVFKYSSKNPENKQRHPDGELLLFALLFWGISVDRILYCETACSCSGMMLTLSSS